MFWELNYGSCWKTDKWGKNRSNIQSGKQATNTLQISQNQRTLYGIIKKQEAMYPKFIINQDGILKFGHVYLHKYLLAAGEQCVYGGGLWKEDKKRGAILLYGFSFDFGIPDFDHVRRINWSGIGGRPLPLFFLPHWPEEGGLVPVLVKP